MQTGRVVVDKIAIWLNSPSSSLHYITETLDDCQPCSYDIRGTILHDLVYTRHKSSNMVAEIYHLIPGQEDAHLRFTQSCPVTPHPSDLRQKTTREQHRCHSARPLPRRPEERRTVTFDHQDRLVSRPHRHSFQMDINVFKTWSTVADQVQCSFSIGKQAHNPFAD